MRVTTDELRQAMGEIQSGDVIEFTAEGGFRVKPKRVPGTSRPPAKRRRKKPPESA